MTAPIDIAGIHIPGTADIKFDDPWRWLARGWQDMMRAPVVSFSYGAAFAGMGFLLTYGLISLDVWYVILPLASGFMLLGPVLSVGLYEVSRRHEAGEPVNIGIALRAWRRNPSGIFAVGLVLMLVFLLWIRIATLLFALFYGIGDFQISAFFSETFFSFTTIWFLAIGTIIGAGLATLVFSISAVAFPMIVGRKAPAIQAVLTSIVAVRRNWKPLVLWAMLIMVFSVSGLVVFYVGLIVTLPLIGHASYHAYRDMVLDD